jgi:orotate phosphoribosyltransferase
MAWARNRLPKSETPPLLKAAARLGYPGHRFILDWTGGNGKRSAALGRRLASRVSEAISGPEIDLIGIQYSGGVMASLGSTALRERGYEPRLIGFYPKGLGPDFKRYFDDEEVRAVPQVLVDNSVHTGQTLKTAVDMLTDRGFFPTTFIKMVHYGDETDVIAEQIAAESNMRCISLYDARELGRCSYVSPMDRLEVWMGYLGNTAFDARTKLPLVEP